jgi:uncharacterized protein involved in exopolysaccharide biosynthesis
MTTAAQPEGNAKGVPAEGHDPVIALANSLLRWRKFILNVSVLALFATLGLTVLRGPRYSSSASFAPQVRRAPSNAAGVAAQLGITLNSAEGGQSPQFYHDLLKTRAVLRPVITRNYARPESPRDSASLLEILNINGPDEPARVDRAERQLKRAIVTGISIRTGVVSFTIRMKKPELARDVARAMIASIQEFNVQSRQSSATAERRFTERRLTDVRIELRSVEDTLRLFLERNRDYRNSPALAFAFDRLSREVALRQAVYTQVAQALEQSKIEEIRDTPVLTVVDEPIAPPRPDNRQWLLKSVAALAIGALAAILMAFGMDYLAGARARRSSATEELNRQIGAIFSHVPWLRRFRRHAAE